MLGEVPSGWSESRVDRVAQVVGGMGFPEKYQGRTGLKYPFLKVSDMNSAGNDRLLFTAANTVSEDDLRSLGAHAWPPGTTVFPKVGAALLTNKRRVLAVEAAFDNNVMGLVPREADPWFLYYFMSTVDFAAHAQTGALPSVNQSTIAAIRLLLPPLPEQKKIAAILSSVDEAIQATQAVIDQTRRVKSGLLQDLLTRGIGHTRFKQTEIGEIPEGWDVVTLRDVVDSARKITYGIVQPGAHKPDGVPLIRGQNYIGGWEPVSKFYRVDPRLHAQYSRSTTRPGDVLLCIVGATTGASAVVPADLPEANITQTTARIAPGTRTTTGFLACYLQSRQGQSEVARLVKGSAQPGLNLADVERFRLPLPPIDEQRLIEMRVSTVDAALESDTAQSERLRRLKTGLLTDLLTGKVRVTP